MVRTKMQQMQEATLWPWRFELQRMKLDTQVAFRPWLLRISNQDNRRCFLMFIFMQKPCRFGRVSMSNTLNPSHVGNRRRSAMAQRLSYTQKPNLLDTWVQDLYVRLPRVLSKQEPNSYDRRLHACNFFFFVHRRGVLKNEIVFFCPILSLRGGVGRKQIELII